MKFTHAAMVAYWNIEGGYLESCNCKTACPCVLCSDPIDGECRVLVARHIDKGRFGDVELDSDRALV